MSKKPPPEPIVLRAHEDSVQALAFLDDRSSTEEARLVSGDAAGHVKLWDLGACRPRASWAPPQFDAGTGVASTSSHMKGVLSLHALHHGRQLVTQLRGGTVTLWDMGDGGGGTPTPIRSLATGSFHFCKVALGSWGGGGAAAQQLLAPTAESEQFQLWDVRQGTRPAHTFATPGTEDRGLCMCLYLLGGTADVPCTHALAMYEDGTLHGWDLRSLASSAPSASSSSPAFSAKLLDKDTPLALDLGLSGKRGVVSASGTELVLFDLDVAAHECVKRQSVTLKHPGVGEVKVRADEKLFATGGWDHRVRLFRWQDGAPLAVLKSHGESVNALAFSPDMHTLASGGKDARVALWEGLYPPTDTTKNETTR